MRIRDVGDRALLVELPGLDDVLGLAAALRASPPPGTIDVVPATSTVLVSFADRASARAGAEQIGRIAVVPGAADAGPTVQIDTVYDGPDLLETAELIGVSSEALVSAHSESEWVAAFGGFAPGFAYLTGGDPRLDVPRLSSPRTAVPAGSVAIAGGFSAVYPGESPGGWRLLGRTEAALWDVSRTEPALIAPGTRVKFRPVRASVKVAGEQAAPHESAAGPPRAGTGHEVTIVDPGFLSLLEDGGRPGRAAIGVTGSGALDRGALARANAAVGNGQTTAGIESLNGGLVIEANAPVAVAVGGAPGTVEVRRAEDGTTQLLPAETRIDLLAGDRVAIGIPETGLRRYLAIRGGVLGVEELGSAAHDSLSGLGTPPLARGHRLGIGRVDLAQHQAQDPDPDQKQDPERATETTAADPYSATGTHVLRYVPGPRGDWFTAASRDGFGARDWIATAQSNRIGLRLDAADGAVPLERERDGELPTEGTVAGSIQIPPSGLPVLFLADRPVTGGYPVIGTVIDADLDAAAQVRPGERIRFQAVTPDRIAPRITAARAAREIPAVVPLTLEANGRRIAIAIPGALAAALDRLVRESPDGLADETIAAFLASIVGESLRSSD